MEEGYWEISYTSPRGTGRSRVRYVTERTDTNLAALGILSTLCTLVNRSLDKIDTIKKEGE